MIKLTWPLPALLAWISSWLFYDTLLRAAAPEWIALLLPVFWSGFLTRLTHTTMRKALVGLGFPLSYMGVNGGLNLPPVGWLVLLLVVILVYPRRAWQDAPLFPTPKKALRLLPDHITLLAGARILDAGSGMGDGLIALRNAFPRADFTGIEMSWPLRFLSALRCTFARIRQGDIWQADWSSYDLVYLFQRPETMPRAVEKAEAQLRPGAWLVSLEFEARELKAQAVVESPDGRPVWIYQLPFERKPAGAVIRFQ